MLDLDLCINLNIFEGIQAVKLDGEHLKYISITLCSRGWRSGEVVCYMHFFTRFVAYVKVVALQPEKHFLQPA